MNSDTRKNIHLHEFLKLNLISMLIMFLKNELDSELNFLRPGICFFIKLNMCYFKS